LGFDNRIPVVPLSGTEAVFTFSANHPSKRAKRELRHANVHDTPTQIEMFSRRAIWPKPEGDVEFDYTGYRILDVDREIRKTIQSRCYSEAHIEAMISWLDRDQSEWGIQNTVVRAAERYLEILLRRGNRSRP
jgi:hypothetical protein